MSAARLFRPLFRPLLLALPVVAALGMGSAWARDQAVLVDLTTVDRDGLAALKATPGAAWWIEAGEVMLLAGDVAAIRTALPARQVLLDLGTVDPTQLALHARGCGDGSDRVAPGALLIPGASYDLVRRPRAFSPIPAAQPAAIAAHLGAPEWQPVAPNSTIARLHRLDRPDGAPAADPGIVPIADRVDGQRWFDTVSTLASFDRSSYSAELVPARQWIAGQFAGLGMTVSEPVFSFPFSTPFPLANVIGRVEGSEFPDQWLVVGGHYDSRNITNNASGATDTPGADDNASGCSGVIEAARAIGPFKPRRSIVFMCYAGEEQGLHGSIGHVNALLGAGDLGRVRAMLNMDMIGWSADAGLGVIVATRLDVGNPVDNQALVELVADAGLTYAPALNPDFIVRSSNTCCSDHMPYINAGRPGVMSIHRGSAAAYPHYHRNTDTPANLGPFAQAIGSAIVRMNVAALARLSGASDRIFADGNQGAEPTPPLPL